MPAQADTPVIRRMRHGDMPAIKRVIEANGLFPPDMLDGMTEAYFTGGPHINEVWITDDDDPPEAVAYAAPERMTEGTWNLYLIAVHPDRQGQGRGTEMLRHIEQTLMGKGVRLLLVETSGLAEFDGTRSFYLGRGFEQEARIRDFYQAGEDKIIFRKAL